MAVCVINHRRRRENAPNFTAILTSLLLLNCSEAVYVENGEFADSVLSHQLATFGQSSGVNVTAPIILATPDPYGCESLSSDIPSDHIILVLRGPHDNPCTFVDKAMSVENVNGIAMIVGDDVESSVLLLMGSEDKNPKISIPCAFVNQTSFLTLAASIEQENSKNSSLIVSVDKRGQVRHESHGLPILLLLVLPALWCLVASLYFLKKCMYKRRHRQRREQRAQMIPLVSYRQDTTVEDSNGVSTVIHNESCAICLEEFNEGLTVKLLPCHHAFHQYCIDPWLEGRSELCPICKQSIFKPPSWQSNSTQSDRSVRV